MRLHLTLKSIPELTDLPPGERRIAWHACRRLTYSRWQTWVWTVVVVLIGIGVGLLAFKLFTMVSPLSRRVTYFLAGFICGAIVVGVTETLRSIVISSQVSPFLSAYFEKQREEAREKERPNVEIDFLQEPFDDLEDAD